jgi:hypothetical protein
MLALMEIAARSHQLITIEFIGAGILDLYETLGDYHHILPFEWASFIPSIIARDYRCD